MIEFPVTPSNILFVISIIGTMFGVYLYFRKPQIDSDKNDALMAQSLLEMQKKLTNLDATFSAHIQSDTVAFQQLNSHVIEVDKSLVRLETIIDERIPKAV